MTWHAAIAFLGVAAIVISTPGPDTVLTIRNTLRGGRRAGAATAAGVATGQLIWATGAALGLTAALAASGSAFRVVQAAGAAYLLLLGAVSARHAVRRRPISSAAVDDPTHLAARPALTRSPWSAVRQGVLSNLANPKMAAFFTGLLPPFATHANHPLATMLGLGAAFAALTLMWLSGYAAFAFRAAHVLRRDAVRRVMDAACAVTFVSLGVRVATQARQA